MGGCFDYASAAAASPQSHLCPLRTHLKTEHKLPTLVEALGEKRENELRPYSLWGYPWSVLGNPAMLILLLPHQDR